MVKSRRAASSVQSVVKRTTACRPVRLHVAPQRRHLERLAAGDHGDRAVRNAGRGGFQPGIFRAGDYLVRWQDRRQIRIGDRTFQQSVPHGPADDTRGAAGRIQRLEDGSGLRRPQQTPIAQ
jgi:hypothetical protein